MAHNQEEKKREKKKKKKEKKPGGGYWFSYELREPRRVITISGVLLSYTQHPVDVSLLSFSLFLPLGRV